MTTKVDELVKSHPTNSKVISLITGQMGFLRSRQQVEGEIRSLRIYISNSQSTGGLARSMKKFISIFDRIMDILAFIAGIILVFIMLSVCLEVILRYFLNRPLIWVTQVTECLLLYITFLGTAWLLREEGHVKVDILINRLNPKAVALFGIIASVIGIVVSMVLTIFGVSLTWNYFQRGIYTPTILEIPLSIIIIIIPIGSVMLLLQFIRRTLGFIAEFVIETAKTAS